MRVLIWTTGAPVTDTTFAPIKEALEKFVHTISEGIGAIIVLIAMRSQGLSATDQILSQVEAAEQRRLAKEKAVVAQQNPTVDTPTQ